MGIHLSPLKPLENGKIYLHVGCGSDYIQGYINIDKNLDVKADLYLNMIDLKKEFKPNSIGGIVGYHCIAYLLWWQMADFIMDCYTILEPGGWVFFQQPDLLKCCKRLVQLSVGDKVTPNIDYIEALRGIYGFDLTQIEKRENFQTYMFGWSAFHLMYELACGGFTNVGYIDVERTYKECWRDTAVFGDKQKEE